MPRNVTTTRRYEDARYRGGECRFSPSRHLWSRLTWRFARRLTTICARFVSRNAPFPTKCVMPQLCDLRSLTPNAELATATEKMQRRMRRYKWFLLCSFSNLLSVRDALNCTETGRLTGCPARVVSPSCPIFPPPHLTVVGFCAVLDRTRWHVSQFRHGDDQIPSGGSFRAVPQQHSIFDLRVARGVRYRKGPVRWVP